MEEHRAERRIKAKVTNNVVEFMHNDLADSCYYLKNSLRDAANDPRGQGASYVQVLALITLVAFTLEGYLNFIGETLIKRADVPVIADLAWENYERKGAREKVKEILKMRGRKVDWNKRPFATIAALKSIRDILAHPKAHRPVQREYIAVGTESELRQSLRDYRPDYARKLTPEFALLAYEDVEHIWAELLAIAEIDSMEAWSGGSQGLEFLEHIDDEEHQE